MCHGKMPFTAVREASRLIKALAVHCRGKKFCRFQSHSLPQKPKPWREFDKGSSQRRRGNETGGGQKAIGPIKAVNLPR